MILFFLLFLDLGGKVELDVSRLGNGVFDNDGNLRRHRNDNRFRELGGLGKKVEVPQSKVELDGFFHFDVDAILFRIVGSEKNVSTSNGPANTKAHPFLATRNGASVTQYLKVTDDSLKLSGTELDGALVGSVRNSELVSFNVHELQL